MGESSRYLAFDLGAESGRAVVGTLSGEQLALETIHRFSNGPVRVFDGLYWDVLHLWSQVQAGLLAYRRDYEAPLQGIGLDTWGVDFALLDANGQLLGNPRHYRDPRNAAMLALALERVPREEIFAATGIQFMQLNSLYQLLAMREHGDSALDQARKLLMMPDLLNYWLTGTAASEFTVATTTQFYDPRARDWARDLLRRLGLPTDILPRVLQPGTVLGPLARPLVEESGLGEVPVILPATHDTGSAVAAVPAVGSGYVYLSSGTWSLIGIEAPEPIITPEALAYNFTNEGGIGGTYRVLKNIMGLWLVQECRRTWGLEGETLSYDEITALAEAAPAFGPLVEPDATGFIAPGDMPARIQAFCERSGQLAPRSRGEIVRCALESLACKYRWAVEKLECMAGRPLQVIHIVGGGSQNRLLCQFTADATHRPVVAGPVEATAIGNIMMQAIARGHIGTLEDGRRLVARSFATQTYTPREDDGWERAYDRFLDIHRSTAAI
ncbi:MAG: rhamnulokinase [Chloroflexi bacterium]|nr:rhamnulokinase [Chloroflexota bacterium]